MNMNNTVFGSDGEIIGYRCHICDGIKSRMLGNTCNQCGEIQDNKKIESEYLKMKNEIKALKVIINMYEMQNRKLTFGIKQKKNGLLYLLKKLLKK